MAVEEKTHEHTKVTHLYHIELPFLLDPGELTFEPNSRTDLREVMEALTLDYSEDEIRRVLNGACALLAKFPHRQLAEALDTAMVWERG